MTVFRCNFRLEVDNDVIPGVAFDKVGMDVLVKFVDSIPPAPRFLPDLHEERLKHLNGCIN